MIRAKRSQCAYKKRGKKTTCESRKIHGMASSLHAYLCGSYGVAVGVLVGTFVGGGEITFKAATVTHEI